MGTKTMSGVSEKITLFRRLLQSKSVAFDGKMTTDETYEFVVRYHHQCGKTAGKIEELKNFINHRKSDLEIIFGSKYINEWISDLEEISFAIGVYSVPPPKMKFPNSYLWLKHRTKHTLPVTTSTAWKSNFWWDFLGDSTILQTGGRIAVLLSDEGVEWANAIFDRINKYKLISFDSIRY